MDKPCDFLLGASDPEIDGRLKALPEGRTDLDRRFTHEEEFFLVLPQPYVTDPFEIHQSSREKTPSPRYLGVIRSLVAAWTAQVPGVFRGLSWYFNPEDLFHPLFVQVLAAGPRRYLAVLRPDLTYRGRYAEVLERGSNDTTPRYSSRSLFLEAEILPLETWDQATGDKRLYLAKLFESTWQGETGRGYQRAGRWIDQEITRILSRAALPAGTKTFPHFPLRCSHGTLAVRTATPDFEGRRRAARVLEAAWPLVSPVADSLASQLLKEPYREDHPLVEQLRARWGSQLSRLWGRYRIEASLNSQNQKEYRYHDA